MENLKPPGEMDFTSTGATYVAEKWRKWKQTMELYIQLCLDSKSEKGTFLYVIGQRGHNIYNAMMLQENEKNKIDILFRKFEEYCKPKQNITIKCYRFNSRAQEKHESFNQFVTELKLIARNCSFGDLEGELIHDRVVCRIQNDEVRQHLLRADNLTLDKCLKICRSYEQTQKSVQILADSAHVVVDGLKKQIAKKTSQAKTTNEKCLEEDLQPKYTCSNCGKQHTK